MSKIKFMGSSHVHELLEGDDFSGRLATPLPKTVIFDRSNNWVVDTEEAMLSPEAVAVLMEDEVTFKDVTDLERIPPNLHQTTFLGIPPLDEESAPVEAAATTDESDDESDDDDADTDDESKPTGDDPAVDSDLSPTTTTVGGSTARGGTAGRPRPRR
jgi:hypothetical protein